jgi:hypothetical protein
MQQRHRCEWRTPTQPRHQPGVWTSPSPPQTLGVTMHTPSWRREQRLLQITPALTTVQDTAKPCVRSVIYLRQFPAARPSWRARQAPLCRAHRPGHLRPAAAAQMRSVVLGGPEPRKLHRWGASEFQTQTHGLPYHKQTAVPHAYCRAIVNTRKNGTAHRRQRLVARPLNGGLCSGVPSQLVTSTT